MKTLYERIRRCVRSATPGALKTIRWIVTLTLGISLAMFVLQYVGLLDWISACVSPLFHIFGLRGEAAMAFVSGYFINIYSSIAVISTLDLTAREITILATMSTAAHAILVEGAVLHRTGTPTLYSITLRTLAAIGLGVGLNLILPGRPEAVIGASLGEVEMFCIDEPFWPLFCEWAIGAVRLAVVMCTLIYLLNIFQRILYEFGVMAWL